MRRFFTEPENISDGMIEIIDDARHITNVLRMEPGDLIEVFDGGGYDYTAELVEIDSRRCAAKIVGSKRSELEPEIKATLYQGIPKSDKLDTIIQKAVELGVYEIVPVRTARSVAKISDDKRGAQKISRYNKISVEAAKQCGRGIVPEVRAPIDFEEALAELKEFDLSIMPYEILGHDGDKGLSGVLKANPSAKNIAVIIGPEGGFADSEAEKLKDVAERVGLGKRILRTETAGSALLAIIMYEYGEI